MISRSWIIALVIIVAIGGFLVFASLDDTPRSLPDPGTQDLGQAPDFTVKPLGGGKISLSDFREKVVVVNFWASWCGPCRDEAPELARVSKAYDGRVQFIGIIYQDKEANAKAFIEEFNITYPNGIDPGGAAALAYKITGVPETYVIDREGRLRFKWLGPITEERLSNVLEKVLAL